MLGAAKTARRLYRRLPSSMRCKECLVPFHGLFSIPFSAVQIRPSRKNPPTLCYELAPPGGELRRISVLFVDVRGFTSLAERLEPAQVARLLNRFYALASKAIFDAHEPF
jgi:hypothetical protein